MKKTNKVYICVFSILMAFSFSISKNAFSDLIYSNIKPENIRDISDIVEENLEKSIEDFGDNRLIFNNSVKSELQSYLNNMEAQSFDEPVKKCVKVLKKNHCVSVGTVYVTVDNFKVRTMYCGRLTGAHSTIITRDRTGPLFLMDQFPPIFLTHLA